MDAPFTVVDYIILVVTLLFSLLIGLYYAFFKKQNTNDDLLVGGRNMSLLPIAFSMMATYISAIMILGTPAEVYDYGTLIYSFIFCSFIFVPLSCLIFVPTFYKLKLTSVYEYLELRFDSVLPRWFASATFITQQLLYMGIVLFAPSLAMSAFLHFPAWASIILLGGCATLYTAIGGLRAVVWTDVFQVLVMFIGMMAIFVKCTINVGGFENAFTIASERGRVQLYEPSLNPFVRQTTIGIIFGSGIYSLCTTSTHQPQVQRYSSMESLKSALTALILTIPIGCTLFSISILTGIVIFANYADCDPITLGLIQRTDQLVPLFVVEELTELTGMMGLFLSCLFSASLSTVSSGLNSIAAVVWEDFFSKHDRFMNLSEERKSVVTKFTACGFGVATILTAFLASTFDTIFSAALTINGAVSGPLGGIFVLGLFMPFVNKWGASLGLLCGHAASLWIGVGAFINQVKYTKLPVNVDNCPEWRIANITQTVILTNSSSTPGPDFAPVDDWQTTLYSLSYVLYPLLGILVTVITGVLISLLTGFSSFEYEKSHLIHPHIVRIYEKLGLIKPHDYKPVPLKGNDLKTAAENGHC